MFRSVIRRLLFLSNTDPFVDRQRFYALKDQLLRKYATFRGHDIQEITKECWGDKWDDEGGFRYGCGPNCTRCGGTGIWDQRWVRLQRWEWGPYVFHIPDGDTRIKPDSVQIHGRIEHKNYGRKANEAKLWLYLLCGEWYALYRAMVGSRCCGWYWWPLLNVQRVAMELKMKLMWKCCWCGKWFPTWRSGWQVCKRCRDAPVEIPF